MQQNCPGKKFAVGEQIAGNALAEDEGEKLAASGYKKIILKIFQLMRRLVVVSIEERYKKEFSIAVNRVNINIAKVAATTFVILESIMILISYINNKDDFFKEPDIYYNGMYVLLFTVMFIYLFIFNKLGRNISGNNTVIWVCIISCACFILYWSAGIALLDQLSYGQIIVYVVALITVSAVPLFPSLTLLFILFSAQVLFIFFMPYFQQSVEILYGNYVNSTSFIAISLVISRIRYKNFVDDFHNKKIIQEKSEQLESANKELEDVNRKLEKLLQIDGLTGIFNRSFFDKTLKAEWDRCKRQSIPLSLIYLDIDYFKAFNDNYGHQAGDDCLILVAESLSSCARRSSDVVARYGGDEFTVLLPHVKKDNALQFAERLRSRIADKAIPHAYSPVAPYLTISLGVSTLIPSDQSSIREFILTADQALYEAKKEHNKVSVFQH